ncbi:hypothetical protein VTO73DRAFT_11575 [Trametes versicolor]
MPHPYLPTGRTQMEYERTDAAGMGYTETEPRGARDEGIAMEWPATGTVHSPLSQVSPPPPNEHQAASPLGMSDHTPTAATPRGQGMLGHETQPLGAGTTTDGLALTQSDDDWLHKVTMSDDESTPPTPTPPQGTRPPRTTAGQPAQVTDSAKSRKRARTSYSPDPPTPNTANAGLAAPPTRPSGVRGGGDVPPDREADGAPALNDQLLHHASSNAAGNLAQAGSDVPRPPAHPVAAPVGGQDAGAPWTPANEAVAPGALPPMYEQADPMAEWMADYRSFMTNRIAAAERDFFKTRQAAMSTQLVRPQSVRPEPTMVAAPVAIAPARPRASAQPGAQAYSSLAGWNGQPETQAGEHQATIPQGQPSAPAVPPGIMQSLHAPPAVSTVDLTSLDLTPFLKEPSLHPELHADADDMDVDAPGTLPALPMTHEDRTEATRTRELPNQATPAPGGDRRAIQTPARGQSVLPSLPFGAPLAAANPPTSHPAPRPHPERAPLTMIVPHNQPTVQSWAAMLVQQGIVEVLPEPEGGFPEKHGRGVDSLLRGLSAKKREKWRLYDPDTDFIVQIHGTTDFFDTPACRAYLRAIETLFIKCLELLTGETGFRVFRPSKDKGAPLGGEFATAWLLKNPPGRSKQILRTQDCWPMKDLTFYLTRVYAGVSQYLGSYRGFDHDDEQEIRDALTDTLREYGCFESLARLLREAGGSVAGVDYALEAAQVVASIHLKIFREKCDKGKGEIIASLYRAPPVGPAYHGAWYLWTQTIVDLTLTSELVDSALPWKPQRCTGCHGGDHDKPNCPFESIPGWFGNLNVDFKAHGATFQTAPPPSEQRTPPPGDFRGAAPATSTALDDRRQVFYRPQHAHNAANNSQWDQGLPQQPVDVRFRPWQPPPPQQQQQQQQQPQRQNPHPGPPSGARQQPQQQHQPPAGPSRAGYSERYREEEHYGARPPPYDDQRGRPPANSSRQPGSRPRRVPKQPPLPPAAFVPDYPGYGPHAGHHATTNHSTPRTNHTPQEDGLASGTRLHAPRGVADLPARRGAEDGSEEIGGSVVNGGPNNQGSILRMGAGHGEVTEPGHGTPPGPRDATARPGTAPGPQEVPGVPGANRKTRSKARITIATLNIRGYGLENRIEGSSKWMRVNQLMRDKKIAVLVLQEAHLDDERAALLNSVFENTMTVLSSPDPVNPTAARGVAIAINKRILKDCAPLLRILVPGRAVLLTIPWTAERSLKIVNVYAPNESAANADFWSTLNSMNLGRVDLMLGDYNVVEDSADRLPPREDPEAPRLALQALCDRLLVTDGWRVSHPLDKGYTFLQESTAAQSRLDRIYARKVMMRDCSDWTIEASGLTTDHLLVSVSIENYKAPFHGKGRWSMPVHLLNDDAMKKKMKELGSSLLRRLDAMRVRTQAENPQVAYAEFKRELVTAARTRAKAKIPKMQKRIDRLKLDLAKVVNETNDEVDSVRPVSSRAERAAMLQDRITKLEQKRFDWRRKEVAGRHSVQSETMSRYWMRGNTTPEVSEEMYTMRQPGTSPPAYTNHTRTMAEIARTFYDGIQHDDPLEEDEDHSSYIEEALAETDARLDNSAKATLAQRLDRDDVAEAINAAATGKAPGLDGLPTEVWKAYNRWYDADTKRGAPAVDLTKALRCVYNDIEAHGLVEGSDFAHGWICPVYKLKKDKREISSYRPITLLNSDYKLMTKALASKLAMAAPAIIHEDQAGFIPGRRIFDHIKLSQLVIEYAEAEELNGAIVALDQEKAYDKIDHTYLWAVLRKMNFPDNFIRTLQHLYAGAESCVMVNGVCSKLFRVIRGVRQGDPISCLIFNLAIEPLACALRKSPLRGLSLPGATERLLTKLFADDTTVYLSGDDEYDQVLSITDKWCRAARARFNGEKTEVLPIGTRAYRANVVETRQLNPEGRPIPQAVHIVKDGEAIRLLGAWVGNGADLTAPWLPVMNTIETNLAKWEKARPSLHGRKLAVGIEVAGRTQFRAMVQYMPKSVEQRLAKIEADFLWKGDTHPRIARDQLYRPISEGGLNLLDIKSRNEAIHLMWLRAYLSLGTARPLWATVADALENRSARLAHDRILFDPSLSTGTPLATVFRVFSEAPLEDTRPALRHPRPFQVAAEEVEVFTDGSAKGNGTGDAVAGSGIWFGAGDARNRGERVPYEEQTNQVAEIYAVTMAHRATPPFAPLHVVSDSKYVVNGLTEHLPKWERAPTTLKWVKGHSGVRGNEEADRLAGEGAANPSPVRPLYLPPPEKYVVRGAAVSSLTQRLAYKGIPPGQRTAWALARGMLTKKAVQLPKVTLGIALGGHAYTVLDEKREPLQSETRLSRIVLTETAYLIWVLRCDRVVGNRTQLPQDAEESYIERRWLQALNKRLNGDCVLTNKGVAGRWAIPPATVLATWEKALMDEDQLPADWIHSPGVLVGKPLRQYEPEVD